VSAERIIVLIIGIIVLLAALVLMFSGGALLVANSVLKDSEGFITTRTIQIESDSYAVTTMPADVDLRGAWIWDWSDLVAFKIEGSNNDPSRGTFMGIAQESDVNSYLRDVDYDEITEFTIFPYEVAYTGHPGDSAPTAPTSQGFWDESAHGSGTLSIQWELKTGSWVLVLMNDDGSMGIDFDIVLGAKVPIMFAVGVGFVVGGIVVLAVGVLLIYLAVRKPRKPQSTGTEVQQ